MVSREAGSEICDTGTETRTHTHTHTHTSLSESVPASSDAESSEADTHTNSVDTATDSDLAEDDDDVMSHMTPFVPWDDLGDLDMSSKSDDCLDEVFPTEGLGKVIWFCRLWKTVRWQIRYRLLTLPLVICR